MKQNKYNNVIKATSLFGGVQMLSILLNLLRTKVVAVLLGPSGVGLNGIYNETRELLHCTTNLGLDVSGVRGISQAYEKGDFKTIDKEVSLLRSWVMILALAGMLTCIVLASPLSLFTFGDYEHTWGYVFLSPAVAFSTITCGEMAILKGLRRLKRLATVSVINVALALVISLPIYYLWGIKGVLPALVLCCLAWMLAAASFSYSIAKPTYAFTQNQLRAGKVMIGIGVTFVICEVINHIAQLSIQSYLNSHASLEMVGLYNACRTMTLTYAGMVFHAMEQDYFPRLSGVIKDTTQRAQVLIKQVDVTLMIITPMLIALIVALPVIIPILLSNEFIEITPMAQIISTGLIFRAIYLPHAYMPLAAGDSKLYFSLNFIGALNTFWIIPGYILGGLVGMGVAMLGENIVDLVLISLATVFKYKIRLPRKTIIMSALSILLLFTTYLMTLLLSGWTYWISGIILVIMGTAISYINYTK